MLGASLHALFVQFSLAETRRKDPPNLWTGLLSLQGTKPSCQVGNPSAQGLGVHLAIRMKLEHVSAMSGLCEDWQL